MRRIGILAAAALLSSACGDRGEAWDTVSRGFTLGQLRDSAVLVDPSLNRALIVTARPEQELDFAAVRLGKRIASTTTSVDRARTFVLSQGDEVRLRSTDEGPALTVLEAGHAQQPKRYELPDALTSLALDPFGKFAVVYAGQSTGGGIIKNPNELIVVDLEAPPGADNPMPRTLPSNIGGSPQRLTFSEPLHLPAGDRRLLVVETDRDVMLLDLEHPEMPEVSLPVKDPHTDSRALSPAGIAIDPGQAGGRSPSLAVRTNQDDNVIIYTLGPSGKAPPDNDFIATPNAAVVGGVPSDIVFVNTNQGPRLAVMVPTPTPTGFLIKVDDNQTLTAKFAASYQRISPVAGFTSNTTGHGDQVMLWSAEGRASSIAFWDLDQVPDIPFGSIDTLKAVNTINVNGTIAGVTDIAARDLKIVETTTGALYVLDMLDPEQPLTNALATSGKVTLRYSPEGDRAWGFSSVQPGIAQVTLRGAHVSSIDLDRAVSDLIEIERKDGGRALLALHSGNSPYSNSSPDSLAGSVGITVFDALAPDTAKSRRYAAVMLEGLAP